MMSLCGRGFEQAESGVGDLEHREYQEVGDYAKNHGDSNCPRIFPTACSMTSQCIKLRAPISH